VRSRVPKRAAEARSLRRGMPNAPLAPRRAVMVGGFPRKEGMERKEVRPSCQPRAARRPAPAVAATATAARGEQARGADGRVPPAQVMGKNVSIYKSQASALEKFAAKDVKARLHRLEHA
jgi:hypothetical protein